jgi:hypothetical protein
VNAPFRFNGTKFLFQKVRRPALLGGGYELALHICTVLTVTGRSLRSCQGVFDGLISNPRPPQPFPPAGLQVASPYPQPAPQPRLYTSFEAEHLQYAQQQLPRPIQPRPSRSTDSPNPASTNGETFTIMRTAGPEMSGERQRKKRGRPTKEEAEERDRQLAAEGKVYEPKKRATKKFRASTGTPVPISEAPFPISPVAHLTPLPQTVEAKEDSSSGKRRSKRRASLTQGEPSSPVTRLTDAKDDKAAESPSDRLLARFGDRERAPQQPPLAAAGRETTQPASA